MGNETLENREFVFIFLYSDSNNNICAKKIKAFGFTSAIGNFDRVINKPYNVLQITIMG